MQMKNKKKEKEKVSRLEIGKKENTTQREKNHATTERTKVQVYLYIYFIQIHYPKDVEILSL